jgi:hypothetical protein
MESKSHYTFDKVNSFDGFAGSYALEGEQVPMLVKAFYDSDQEDFHTYIDHICKSYLSKFIIQNIYCFLILVHKDESADIYVKGTSKNCVLTQ